jgi:hypothetical protein
MRAFLQFISLYPTVSWLGPMTICFFERQGYDVSIFFVALIDVMLRAGR